MALVYDIDAGRRLVTITGDYAEPAEWRSLLTRIAADPRYGGGFSFLRDLRASARPVDADAVAGIIAVVRQMWDRLSAHRAAILTRPGVDVQTPALIAHALAEDQNLPLRAFDSMEDALQWLGAGLERNG